jgi:protein-tyrosine phosphatase
MDVADNQLKPSKRLPAAILALCLLGGATWLWSGVVKDRLIPKRWDVVAGHQIYRSGQLSAALVRRTLTRHGIKVIVALTAPDPQDRDQQAEEQAAATLGIQVRRFPLAGDGTGDVQQYVGAVAALIEAERQGRPVLVHCAAGAQRTGGAVAFYRLLVDRAPPADVVREMRQHGCNQRDKPRLLPYINANLATVASALHARGLIDQIPEPLPILSSP